MVTASSNGLIPIREGYSLEMAKTKLSQLKIRIEGPKELYLQKEKKSFGALVLMSLIIFIGVFL